MWPSVKTTVPGVSPSNPVGWIILTACLLGVLLIFTLNSWSEMRHFQTLQKVGAERLELYSSTLEAAIQRLDYLPFIVSGDPKIERLLLDPSQEPVRDQVNIKLQAWQTASDAAALYLMDANGLVLASSNWNRNNSFVGNNYRFRPYFQDAMAGRKGSFFGIGFTTRKPGYFLSHPIHHDGHVIGAAVVKIDMSGLEKDWASGGEMVVVSDTEGVVFLASNPEWRYHSWHPLDATARQRIEQARTYTGQPIHPLPIQTRQARSTPEGRELITLTGAEPQLLADYQRHLPMLGWNLHYLSDLADLTNQKREGILLGSMAALLLGLLALFVAHRRQSRQLLQQSEIRQRRMVQETQAGILVTDNERSIIFANPTAARFFGCPETSMHNTGLSNWLQESELTRLEALFTAAHSGQPAPEEATPFRGVKADGATLPLGIAVRTTAWGGVPGYLVTLHDISALMAAEQALQEAHDQLEGRVVRRTHALKESNAKLLEEVQERTRAEAGLRQAQEEVIQAAKLAGLGQMSAGIVHEVNQPLAALRAFLASAKLLLSQGRLENVDENLDDMDAMAKRMGTIISRLKSFAGKSRGQTVRVSLEKVVDNSLLLLEPRLKNSPATLNWHRPQRPICVMGDEIKLEQVLVNLIHNALDATADLPPGDGQLDIEIAQTDRHACISVSDNGIGISPTDLPQVFDPFFTTKQVGEGLGLGLSVSYGIAQELDGDLEAVNRPEGGTTFHLTLQTAQE
ncbi:MAG: PAS domain S-box protein [Gammaproteobacteria bacterium]|nr:PAS domain S-box protein [Gammaproteobacteria bacterium]